MAKNLNRRRFIQNSVLAGAALTVPVSLTSKESKTALLSNKEKIKIGVIGSGLRGQSHIDLALNRKDCDVTVICDIDPQMIASTLKLFDKKSKPHPKVYSGGPYEYRNMLEKEDIDAVLIATPWEWHSIMATDSMKAGKYTGMEVAGAFSVDECWQLVYTHESTGTHLFFLENVCYRRDVMAILNMVRQDLFGELIHLQCGYQHDLRGVKFNDGKAPYDSGVDFGENAFSEAKWRTTHSVYRNGDLYPTHGIGPAAMYVNINRGNRLLNLTSMSTKARGLREYVKNHPKGGPEHPNAKINYKLGDVVTTLVQTAGGESILLMHDTNLPRPYSLGFRVQGTKGIWMDLNKSIHLEGTSPSHQWEKADDYLKKYDHPMWQMNEQKAEGAGHGGMDYFLLNEFVESVKNNTPAPIDVYDAASWMVITPLSEQSIELGGQPMNIPDFTRGKWMSRKNEFAKI